jgi:hypothetical protein
MTFQRVVWDAAIHCHGHKRNIGCTIDPPKDCPDPTHKCTQPLGAGTGHKGYGYCRFHGGNMPILAMSGERQMKVAAELDAMTGLSLSLIGDRLARVAAAEAMSRRDNEDAFGKYVRAFAQAAERAEGSHLTVEGRVGVLAEASDEELAAVYRRLTDMVEEARRQPPPKQVGPGAPARTN